MMIITMKNSMLPTSIRTLIKKQIVLLLINKIISKIMTQSIKLKRWKTHMFQKPISETVRS